MPEKAPAKQPSPAYAGGNSRQPSPAYAGGSSRQPSLEEQVLLFQVLQQHAAQLQQQAQLVQQRLLELLATDQALGDLAPPQLAKALAASAAGAVSTGGSSSGEVLIPLGSGVFAAGSARPELLADIGAGVFLRRSPAAAKEQLASRRKDTEEAGAAISAELQRTVTALQELAERIQAAAEQAKKAG